MYGVDPEILGGTFVDSCQRAATLTGQISTMLRRSAAEQCPVFGTAAEGLTQILHKLAGEVDEGGKMLAELQAVAQSNAGDQGDTSQAGTEPASTRNDSYWEEIIGGLQVVGGAAEIAAGVALLSVPVAGWVIGPLIILHGLDGMVMGGRTLANDSIEHEGGFQYVLEKAYRAANFDEQSAHNYAAATDIGIGILGGAAALGRGALARGAASGGRAMVRNSTQMTKTIHGPPCKTRMRTSPALPGTFTTASRSGPKRINRYT